MRQLLPSPLDPVDPADVYPRLVGGDAKRILDGPRSPAPRPAPLLGL